VGGQAKECAEIAARYTSTSEQQSIVRSCTMVPSSSSGIGTLSPDGNCAELFSLYSSQSDRRRTYLCCFHVEAVRIASSSSCVGSSIKTITLPRCPASAYYCRPRLVRTCHLQTARGGFATRSTSMRSSGSISCLRPFCEVGRQELRFDADALPASLDQNCLLRVDRRSLPRGDYPWRCQLI
jgi:hypothetical protein